MTKVSTSGLRVKYIFTKEISFLPSYVYRKWVHLHTVKTQMKSGKMDLLLLLTSIQTKIFDFDSLHAG